MPIFYNITFSDLPCKFGRVPGSAEGRYLGSAETLRLPAQPGSALWAVPSGLPIKNRDTALTRASIIRKTFVKKLTNQL